MIIAPIILALFSVLILLTSIGSACSSFARGGSVVYDEKKMQDYAFAQYNEAFGDSGDAYEDNLLVVFLVNEEADGYYTIAFVGDNIRRDISDMFGNEYTEYGRAVSMSISPEDYTYSLSSGLAAVMERMTDEVVDLGLDSSFYIEESHADSPEPHLVNHSSLSMNEKTVERGLIEFTEKTDIPAVIVVDSMEAVFGKTIFTGDVFFVIIAIGMAALAVTITVKAFKENKKKEKA